MTEEVSTDYSSTFDIPYSDISTLNTVDVHVPHTTPDAAKHTNGDTSTPLNLWIIFIHGGAWRDPRQTSRDVMPTLKHLSPSEHGLIAGVASINYRLSPHPKHPAEPGSPDDRARSARHPEHIEDVCTALAWLQKTYAFTGNYILAGHSAGATLAFQSVMDRWKVPNVEIITMTATQRQPAPPIGIVGLCGIYDLKRLVDTHADQPIYREMITGAFGEDTQAWAKASPVSGTYHDTWPTGKAAVIAPSADDELVDFVQAEAMSDQLWNQKSSTRRDVVISLKGKHDQVIAEGHEVARAIIKCLEMVSV